MNKKSNGVKIIVESSEAVFHSMEDWGLYITNTKYIGEPKQNTSYLTVPGTNKQIDLSEAIAGHITYISREIKIELEGINAKETWDEVISEIRNSISGRICHFIFDNDKSYYWKGRVTVKDTSQIVRHGKLTIAMPEAEPYKYDIVSSNEPWLWDSFNFNNGVIRSIGIINVNGKASITIEKGSMLTVPIFICNDVSDLTVTDGVTIKRLINGSNKDPRIRINGDNKVKLDFEGTGKVQLVYRGGSL